VELSRNQKGQLRRSSNVSKHLLAYSITFAVATSLSETRQCYSPNRLGLVCFMPESIPLSIDLSSVYRYGFWAGSGVAKESAKLPIPLDLPETWVKAPSSVAGFNSLSDRPDLRLSYQRRSVL
jgi:hypothetical protein